MNFFIKPYLLISVYPNVQKELYYFLCVPRRVKDWEVKCKEVLLCAWLSIHITLLNSHLWLLTSWLSINICEGRNGLCPPLTFWCEMISRALLHLCVWHERRRFHLNCISKRCPLGRLVSATQVFRPRAAEYSGLIRHWKPRRSVNLGQIHPPASGTVTSGRGEPAASCGKPTALAPELGSFMPCFFSLSFFFFFNWSIVDLQYYISFRCTAQWFNIFTDNTLLKVFTR